MTSPNLLLISSSRSAGRGYLDHCVGAIRNVLGGAEELLFVPYALHDLDDYAATARDRLGREGIVVRSVHEAADPVAAVEQARAVFIGGGNTFRLLTRLYEHALLAPIRARVAAGMPYLGTSAGSNVACPTIQTTNDMPIVEPPSLRALGLVPFSINPHYVDRDPDVLHHGETREQRIREFHEMNDRVVVGLREGAMLEVRGSHVTLLGDEGARVFRRGHDPEEVAPGARLDWLLIPAEGGEPTL